MGNQISSPYQELYPSPLQKPTCARLHSDGTQQQILFQSLFYHTLQTCPIPTMSAMNLLKKPLCHSQAPTLLTLLQSRVGAIEPKPQDTSTAPATKPSPVDALASLAAFVCDVARPQSRDSKAPHLPLSQATAAFDMLFHVASKGQQQQQEPPAPAPGPEPTEPTAAAIPADQPQVPPPCANQPPLLTRPAEPNVTSVIWHKVQPAPCPTGRISPLDPGLTAAATNCMVPQLSWTSHIPAVSSKTQSKRQRPSSQLVAGEFHEYKRAKGSQKGRGVEQEYICGYCSRKKTSTSQSSHGRVRIRCECGGQHLDGKPRMHATWTPVGGVGARVHLGKVNPNLNKSSKKDPTNTVTTIQETKRLVNLVFVDETIRMHPRVGVPSPTRQVIAV